MSRDTYVPDWWVPFETVICSASHGIRYIYFGFGNYVYNGAYHPDEYLWFDINRWRRKGLTDACLFLHCSDGAYMGREFHVYSPDTCGGWT